MSQQSPTPHAANNRPFFQRLDWRIWLLILFGIIEIGLLAWTLITSTPTPLVSHLPPTRPPDFRLSYVSSPAFPASDTQVITLSSTICMAQRTQFGDGRIVTQQCTLTSDELDTLYQELYHQALDTAQYGQSSWWPSRCSDGGGTFRMTITAAGIVHQIDAPTCNEAGYERWDRVYEVMYMLVGHELNRTFS